LASEIRIVGLQSIPLVKPGDDLVRLIVEAVRGENVSVQSGDIFVVGQKVISKCEGLVQNLGNIRASSRAKRIAKLTSKDPRFVELVLRGSAKLVRAVKKILLVETVSGAVCLNAGVDKSNVEGRLNYSYLPEEPGIAGEQLRSRLKEEFGCELGVVITDSFSRAFRKGQVECAIGGAGVEPIVDYRGSVDLFGYQLQFKSVAVVDEVAAAAELVMGQGTERIPVAIVKGLTRIRMGYVTWDSRDLRVRRREDIVRGTL
jgi:coenzyme F420-0:L-glutamate ligase/coenzyme F420-1:gamma-L-glutamate ligase